MKALAATRVEERTSCAEFFEQRGDLVEETSPDTSLEKPSTCPRSLDRVAWVPRATLVWLEQIAVAAARDVKRVAGRAVPLPFTALERMPAIADGTDDLDHAR